VYAAALDRHEDSQTEAKQLWEEAIAAKGGRERLYSVNNVQVSIRERDWHFFSPAMLREENLYVFPDRYWGWFDERPTVLGLHLEMYNLSRHLAYSVGEHGPLIIMTMNGGEVTDSGKYALYELQLLCLMETKWVRPVPISVAKDKINGHKVDLVQTIVKGYPNKTRTDQRVAFALDPNSHLPRYVIIYLDTRDGVVGYPRPLSDYVEFNGIKIPQDVESLHQKYQINVEYDERIFEQQPTVEAGPQAWKPTKPKQSYTHVQPNKSLDASGGGVFRIIIGPAMAE
jgi:hypothetical protein